VKHLRMFGIWLGWNSGAISEPAKDSESSRGAALGEHRAQGMRARARRRIGTLGSHAAGHRRYCEWSLSNSYLRASFPALLAAAIV
jgi:hypothetical protein